VIRLSQPTFLCLLALGAMIISLSPLLMLGKPTQFSCNFKFFFVHVGFTFSSSCLLWKIDRAFRVYKAAKYMQRVAYTNKDLYKNIGMVTSVDIILQVSDAVAHLSLKNVVSTIIASLSLTVPLVTLTSSIISSHHSASACNNCNYSFHFSIHSLQLLGIYVQKAKPTNVYTSPNQNVNLLRYIPNDDALNFNSEVLEERCDCLMEDDVVAYLNFFEVLSFLLKSVLVFSGCFLAYRTRKFNPQFAESTALMLIIYTIALITTVMGIMIMGENVKIARVTQLKMYAGSSCYCMVFTLLLIYGPRAWQLIFYGDIVKEELLERTQKLQPPKRIASLALKSNLKQNNLGSATKANSTANTSYAKNRDNNKSAQSVDKNIDDFKRERRVSSVFSPRAIAISTDHKDYFQFDNVVRGAHEKNNDIEITKKSRAEMGDIIEKGIERSAIL